MVMVVKGAEQWECEHLIPLRYTLKNGSDGILCVMYVCPHTQKRAGKLPVRPVEAGRAGVLLSQSPEVGTCWE